MFYLVLQPVTIAGVTYQPGDVLDLGDLEQATQMLHAARGAICETSAAPVRLPEPLAPPVVPLPQPELRAAAAPKHPRSKRG